MRNTTQRRTAMGLAVALVIVLTAAACGTAGSSSNAQTAKPTEVQVTLSEFKIESTVTTFKTGTTYTFVIKNAGKASHDWQIMPRGETDTSKALVKVDEEQLPPGASVTQEFTFTQPGDFEFACHVPGHYEAGMLLPITVQ